MRSKKGAAKGLTLAEIAEERKEGGGEIEHG